MSQFPIAEAEITELAAEMIAGLSAHPADFPSTDPAAVETAKTAYETARNAQVDAIGTSRIATEAKNDALAALEKTMKTQIRRSQTDVVDDPVKLELIGWGPRCAATPIEPPAQPGSLEATLQGPGIVTLQWKKPTGTGGQVRDYLIEIRSQPTGGGEFTAWTLEATTLQKQVKLTGQPRGIQIEYRIKARNFGGQSNASNAIAVVL